MKRIREPREYFGVVLMPVSGSMDGIRWCARMDGVPHVLKTNALAGIKELIRHERTQCNRRS